MADLSVNFLHPTNGQIITVTIDDTMTCREVIGELIANDFVSASPEGYDLAIKGGSMLEGQKSMAQNGVREGMTIRVIPATDAGSSSLTPQEIRKKRLMHDYQEMLNIRGDIISWTAVKGEPPYVEEYEITIFVRGIISEVPLYRDSHRVKIVLPSNYPNAAPDTKMISQPMVFHPNWWQNGKWCYGSWIISEGLGHHVIRMVRTLQYDFFITNEKSPANIQANEWYMGKKNSGLFPCDKKQLPDPTHKKFRIQEPKKKKFEIKMT